ncbi:MAG TPA: TonB-dependent receptor plug domain-containing protein [Steroidobacteraceae bacterium]|nr:TonB-dependent receptor plug domain-containing protein [Steroidobacteraceae bacterium]
MKFPMGWRVSLAVGCLLAAPAFSADDSLQEIIVTASLRGVRAADLPQSVTVLDQSTLRGAGVQHFEDVLGLVPDLNWAAGTSRPRFFQLRGIGEVEQYQGAPNPSVGFLIDDIDFSGVGMPATLFDTRQIEVLRGPQGAAYGANALAGLISVRTVDPGSDFELNSEVTAGDYDTRAASLAVGDGFAGGSAGWRLVAQQYRSDGFRRNAFLNGEATDGYDEGVLRGKLRWQITDDLRADLALMHANINNGYDAWSIYNTYTTYSNQPGRDAQMSNGLSLRLVDSLEVGELRSVTSAADSNILYSFDGDWGNDALWGQYAPYDYFQSDHRRRRTLAEDLRLIGDPSRALFGRIRWLAGVYALRLTEADALAYTYDDQYSGAGVSGLDSKYSATNVALYGSLDANLDARTVVSAGLRLEQRDARYADDADVASPFPKQTNHMMGGNLSWDRTTGDGQHVYVTLARGYKGGGFNIGSQILAEQRSFGPESLWSVETGFKYAQATSPLQLQADVFYMRRQHMQVYLSEQLQQNNPLAYVFYTQNASDGENYGLEGEAAYRVDSRWQLSGSASLLRTRYLGVTGVFDGLGLDGRAQPFAPGYKLSAAVEYHTPAGWFARLDASALGSFYYYTSDAQASRAYNLENLRAGYQRGSWTTSLWVRNLFDARYAQQGFYFGLIPPNFPNQSFLQLGDPRQVGVTIDYSLGRR